RCERTTSAASRAIAWPWTCRHTISPEAESRTDTNSCPLSAVRSDRDTHVHVPPRRWFVVPSRRRVHHDGRHVLPIEHILKRDEGRHAPPLATHAQVRDPPRRRLTTQRVVHSVP